MVNNPRLPRSFRCLVARRFYSTTLPALSTLKPPVRTRWLRRQDVESWFRFDYHRDLWLERQIKSVANVTRQDVREFIEIAARSHFLPAVTEYPLEEAPRALRELATGNVRGAKMLGIR